MPLNYPPLGYTGEVETFSNTSQSKEGIVRAATAAEVTAKTRSDLYLAPSTLAGGISAVFTSTGGSIVFTPSGTTINADVSTALITSTTVVLTSAQIKALRATPITIIPAPGAGKTILFDNAQLKLIFGTNAFTGAQNLALRYTGAAGVIVSSSITGAGFIDQAANTYTSANLVANAIVAATGAENQPIVLHNTGAAEITGNAANDNTVKITVFYAILTQ